MTVIDRILTLKEERNLTNRDVEIGAGLANSSISQWKKGKGKPSLDNIVKLSKFFHVSSDYLLCLTDDCVPKNEISLTPDGTPATTPSDKILSDGGESPASAACAQDPSTHLSSKDPAGTSGLSTDNQRESHHLSGEEYVLLEIFRNLPGIDRFRLIQYCMNLRDEK